VPGIWLPCSTTNVFAGVCIHIFNASAFVVSLGQAYVSLVETTSLKIGYIASKSSSVASLISINISCKVFDSLPDFETSF
jgi:hypothetical protein